MGTRNRLIKLSLALLFMLLFGTIGYSVIEGWSIADAFYMTVITITTVGFAETQPLSQGGRVFTVILALGGVGTAIYILTSFVQTTFESEFGTFRRRRMEARIKKLNQHFILCGYGRVGEAIASTLKLEKADFVVIEHYLNSYTLAVQEDCLAIMDDATKHEVLVRAGIQRARGLITAFGDDAYNTYAVLTARELNPELIIISRASNNEAARRLKQAGASHIILPEVIGGQQMARLSLRPTTVQYIETVLAGKEGEVIVEKIFVGEGSSLIGLNIQNIMEQFPGVRILAMRGKEGNLIVSPGTETQVEMGCILTAFGTMEQLQAVEGSCSLYEKAAHINLPK
ncbi:MAG: potassium channel protein [Dehalococcoidia bacterium]|nr:potassium channel protein [Dehalococcoidia bacterium]MDD5493492.1 potassium channel protein [Dehalococcoidia bacterium]